MSQMCRKNYFAQPIMKVIDKRNSFKTNNSSEFLYGLHISNDPTMRGEDVMNILEEICTAIHVIHNRAEYNLA